MWLGGWGDDVISNVGSGLVSFHSLAMSDQAQMLHYVLTCPRYTLIL